MLREFRDETGVKWRVWDVRPAAPMVDRRVLSRRGSGGDSYLDQERRLTDERRSLRGTYLANGWLAFDSVLGRRRLLQIPETWTQASDSELCKWCRLANKAEPRLEWGRSSEY